MVRVQGEARRRWVHAAALLMGCGLLAGAGCLWGYERVYKPRDCPPKSCLFKLVRGRIEVHPRISATRPFAMFLFFPARLPTDRYWIEVVVWNKEHTPIWVGPVRVRLRTPTGETVLDRVVGKPSRVKGDYLTIVRIPPTRIPTRHRILELLIEVRWGQAADRLDQMVRFRKTLRYWRRWDAAILTV
jgi:hypothetical protein